MRKRKAIKLLEKQKQEFVENAYSDINIWRQKTASLIIDFMGKDSAEYVAFYNHKLQVLSHPLEDDAETLRRLKRKDEIMIGLLDNCIGVVKRNGIQSSNTPSPSNIIYRLAKNPIIQGISIVVVIYSFLKIIEAMFCIDIPLI